MFDLVALAFSFGAGRVDIRVSSCALFRMLPRVGAFWSANLGAESGLDKT